MSVVVTTNMDSIIIQGCLNSATNGKSTAMERLATGLKINSAKDDAAGSVISTKMGVQLSGTQVAQNNVQSGAAMLDTMEGNIDTALDNVERIRNLALQAKNGTYTSTELEAMNKEVTQRIEEIDRISDSAKYSEISLFNDTSTTGKQKVDTKLQVGSNSGTNNTITISKSLFQSIHLTAVSGSGTTKSDFDFTSSSADFDTMITKLDTAVTNLTSRTCDIGALENRLDSAADTLETQYENLSSSRSVIRDADMAEESSNYTQQYILEQISTALLAQANQSATTALSLVN